jgi:hypothetical protein
MESVVASAASVGGRAELPRRLLEPMQRQLELVQEVLERERRLQKQLAGHLIAPVDATFDLLEENGLILRKAGGGAGDCGSRASGDRPPGEETGSAV